MSRWTRPWQQRRKWTTQNKRFLRKKRKWKMRFWKRQHLRHRKLRRAPPKLSPEDLNHRQKEEPAASFRGFRTDCCACTSSSFIFLNGSNLDIPTKFRQTLNLTIRPCLTNICRLPYFSWTELQNPVAKNPVATSRLWQHFATPTYTHEFYTVLNILYSYTQSYTWLYIVIDSHKYSYNNR